MKKRGPLLAAFCIPLLITLIICVKSIRSGISVCFISICTISIVRFLQS